MAGEFMGAIFWLFLAVVVVARIWQEVTTRREAETTIRLAIERGQPLDPAVIDRLLRPRKDQVTMRGGVVIVATGVGLAIMGYFLRLGGKTDALYPLLGAGSLLVLVGLALLLSWWITHRDESGADTYTRPPA